MAPRNTKKKGRGRGRGGPARVQSTRSSNPSTRSESPVSQPEESLDGRSERHTPSTTFQPRPRSPRSRLSLDPVTDITPQSRAGTPFDTPLSPVLATDITPQSRAGTPFDTPGLPAAEAVNVTIKAKLDAIQDGPRPRFAYKVAEHPWAKESLDSIIRRVSRDTRWHAFLFHGKYYWAEILSQYFLPPGKSKDNLPADDDEVFRVKVKIFDTIKNIKSDTLKKFDSHLDLVLKDHPELAVMDLANPNLIKNFFINNIWSISTFQHIWFWMRGYVDLERSSELARYYVKQIYGALCYATLLVKRADVKEVGYHRQRRHALYFECVVEPNFDKVAKSEFFEIDSHCRASHHIVSAPANSILCMMGSMPPPPPPA